MLCIYGSTRRGANSELLADRVTEGLSPARIHLADLDLPRFDDLRHAPGGFAPVGPALEHLFTTVLEHDPVLFVTPLYWYGMSGLMKSFVDHWSHALRDPRLQFKERMRGKECYVIVTGGDNPRHKALPLVQQFRLIFDFVGASFAGYIIGEGNQPGEVLKDERALSEAAWLNRQLRERMRARP